jgi:type VII secretion-associated serine protease mycosin
MRAFMFSLFLAAAVLVLGMPSAVRADAIRDMEWHLSFLDIGAAHRITEGEGVIIGLPDTGVDVRHPDLADVVTDGTFVGGFGDPRKDSVGHGTAMAGIIAARGHGPDHADGVLGIAPRASILSVQTLFGDLGAPRDLGVGISWAVQHGAKVMCIAAVTSEDETVTKAIREAIGADVMVIAGVGNAPKDVKVGFPARLPGVLAVGGVDQTGNHAAISATGPEMMISAPAVDIVSTDAYGEYGNGTGTSDATAIVAGAAALVRAKYPNLSAPEVIHRLTATATDKGPPGRDPEYGFGVLNIVKALTADVSPASSVAPTAPVANPRNKGRDAKSIPLAIPLGVAGAVLVAIAAMIVVRRRRAD